MKPMPEHLLDLETWPRRRTFDHFAGYAHPNFSICTRIDVAALKPALAQTGLGSVSLACHYLALQLANAIENFRYRQQGGGVRVMPLLHASTTVLRSDGSFGFANLHHRPDFAGFAAAGALAMAAAREGTKPAQAAVDEAAFIYCTTLPWLHFSSFTHARNGGLEDSIPKFAFGRIEADGDKRWMPLSVEVNHALMDGLHVGRFVQAYEAAMREPLPWISGAPIALPGPG
jgi:chloramphenicol O-acetyltransferase type A